jgi:probable phosphoglycerate mutase
MRLLLIRHGEAEVAKRQMIGGLTGCLGLTELGRTQAQALARRLETMGELKDCAALLSSPLRRARETAAVLRPALGVDSVQEHCDLCELHPGLADGLTWPEYVKHFGFFDMIDEPDRPFAPEAETNNEFMKRIRAALQRLASEYAGRTVVVVSHGGLIMGSLVVSLGIPRPGSRARMETANTGITEWRVNDGVWSLVRFNDTAHLVGFGEQA